MRILVVEDNAKLAGHLRRGLAESGYVVDVATDGIAGRHMAMEGSYDLLLLDVMLPGADGFTLLETLRQHKDTPVIMLTAADSVEDRVRGLRAGADDYLVKPFVFTELLARIQAVLRRGAAGAHHEPDRMVLWDLELDTIRRRAFRAGTRLDLTAQEYTLLSVLLRIRPAKSSCGGEVAQGCSCPRHFIADTWTLQGSSCRAGGYGGGMRRSSETRLCRRVGSPACRSQPSHWPTA